jgi:hypothetical protein
MVRLEGLDVRLSKAEAMRQSGAGTITAILVLMMAAAGCQGDVPSGRFEPSDSRALASARPGEILVADGVVDIQGSEDGTHLELVLVKEGGATIVLASIPEKTPNQAGSFGSIHTVDCPPSTGVTQRYYIVGQQTYESGPVRIEGLKGIAAQMTNGLYLIAITSDPLPPGAWTVFIADQQAGGGLGSSLLDLPNSGHRTDAGCFYFL